MGLSCKLYLSQVHLIFVFECEDSVDTATRAHSSAKVSGRSGTAVGVTWREDGTQGTFGVREISQSHESKPVTACTEEGVVCYSEEVVLVGLPAPLK